MSQDKLIDIEKVIASKSKKASKWTPRFLINYLKRILHEKEINQYLIDNKDKKNVEWCTSGAEYMNITVDIKGMEKIPKSGKIVLAMNHPLGGMDAVLLVHGLRNHRTDLKFIVNDLLMNIENMQDMFVGVNKHGKNKSSIRVQISELFQSDNAVCIFPAGLVSRKQKGEVKDLVWKKTFVTYSKEYDRTIVPIYIDGTLSKFFYRIARLRKFLGIKANLEMLYLANEMYKQKNSHMTFVVGDPIEKEMLHSTDDDKQLAQDIKEKVYELRNQL